MPSDSGSAWSPPAGSGERRLSNSSDGSAGSGYSKAVSTDSGEYVRTRTTVAAGARPPVNPLQFVKVGPCDLYRTAQEQLKRAEEVKKSKEVKKEEQEDWQSNLDNWKSSRRKRVEHIIERCVEVKKMENEPVPGARAKNKTFNEMLEERAGKRRRCPLNLYTEEEVTDLSDLGIGTSSTKSSLSEDCDTHSLTSDGVEGDKNHSDVDTISNCDNTNRKQVLSSNEYDTCTTTTISSPEPEEYTYEGAIEGYKSRIISQTHTNIINTQYKSYGNNKYEQPEPTTEKTTKNDINFIRTTVSNKIEAKVTSFQQTRQNSVTEITKSRKDLPKVDVLKRRELFEKENSPDTFSLSKNRSSTDLANKKSIKERLSNLEKFNEDNHQKSSKDLNKIPVEVASIKDRLTSLEKVKSSGTDIDKTKRLSNGDLANTRSIKERLSSFKSQVSEDESKLVKAEVKEVSQSLKERLSNLDAARNKEIVRQTSDVDFNLRHDKEDKNTQRDAKKEEFMVSSNRSSMSGLELQMQNFCRSLDSLDINDSSMHSPFERVQSLEDFDTCREPLNNTTPSDIETEDSGVHTAHGSCAVSQVDETAESVDLQTVEILAEEQETRDISEPELSNDDMCSKLSVPESPLPPEVPQYDSHVDTDDDKIDESEDTSSKEFQPALSQVDDEISATEDTTEIHLDKEDEDTVKSLDNQDTSVIDALELAFKEIDSEDSTDNIEEVKAKMSDGQTQKQENGFFSIQKPESIKDVEIPPVVEAKVKQLETLTSNISINESKPMPFTKKDDMIPLYENIEIFYQNGGAFPMALNGDSVSEDNLLILDLPSHAMEPPKEKPPPPPVEDNVEDELLGNGNFKSTNSTRRIKKEIRNKRSSFLGIEGQLDDSYLDADLKLTPRPDITSFLQEESRVEKMLFKKTLNHDKDSTLHQSRDSGVDLDRGHTTDWLNKHISSPEDSSNNHSRQNSEPYTITVTSDEEEMALKQERSKQHTAPTGGYQDAFNENLTNKLENLQKENLKDHFSSPPDAVPYERARINNLEKQINEQQSCNTNADYTGVGIVDDNQTKEVLRFERELLQLEQEELKRQRDNLLIRESQARRKLQNQSVQDVSLLANNSQHVNGEMSKQRSQSSHRHSMPNLLVNQEMYVAPKPIERTVFAVMEDVNVTERSPRKVVVQNNFVNKLPPPVPPSKPRSIESQEREITMRSSRVPSAVEYPSVQLRQKPVPNGQVNNQQYHPMSRHTLQILSAAPTSKLISGSDWLQVKRRKQPPPTGYNYNQHWLIQEAEQRRIEEQRNNARQRFQQPATNQRQSYQPNTTVPTQRVQSINPRTQDIAGSKEHLASVTGQNSISDPVPSPGLRDSGEKMLSVSGRKKCSHCGEELGRGAAMIIESLSLCYHVWCFTCVVCGTRLGDGRAGADVRVRARRLHCHQCYSSEDGRKFSCV